MILILLRDLHSFCIFIHAIKSELLTFIFQSDIENLNSYQTITILLQSKRLNQLTLTPLATPDRNYPTLPLATSYPLSVCQNVRKMRDVSFFYKTLGEE